MLNRNPWFLTLILSNINKTGLYKMSDTNEVANIYHKAKIGYWLLTQLYDFTGVNTKLHFLCLFFYQNSCLFDMLLFKPQFFAVQLDSI